MPTSWCNRALIAALGLGPGAAPARRDEPNLDRIAGEISFGRSAAPWQRERDTVDRLIASGSRRVGRGLPAIFAAVSRAGLPSWSMRRAERTASCQSPRSATIFYEYQETQHRLVGRGTRRGLPARDTVEVRLCRSPALCRVPPLELCAVPISTLARRSGSQRFRSRWRPRPPAKAGDAKQSKSKAGKRKDGEPRQSRRKRAK
jgi:hypothetical protein